MPYSKLHYQAQRRSSLPLLLDRRNIFKRSPLRWKHRQFKKLITLSKSQSRFDKLTVPRERSKQLPSKGDWIAGRLHSCFSPSSPEFNSQCSRKNFRAKNIDVAEVNQLCWVEESGQWLDNVDRTHLVLAGGKPVLQKTKSITLHQGSLFFLGGSPDLSEASPALLPEVASLPSASG